MKKLLSIIFLVVLGSGIATAQEDSLLNEYNTSQNLIKNKNGYVIVPEAGDFALGLSTNSIFSYLGNMFNGTIGNAAPFTSFRTNGTNAIFFKYFLSETSALRASFRFDAYTNLNSVYVQDDNAVLNDPLSNAQVTDVMKYMTRNYSIGFGYEGRKGKTRLQGIYGANIGASYGNLMYEYKYGNPMSDDNTMPTTYNFGSNLYGNGRILNNYNGENWSVGANVFAGLEYFILPKISIGVEFSYGFNYNITRQSSFTYEYWNVDHVEMTQATDPGNVSRYLGTTNPSANIFLMFHF